ncbi:hypothetical protein ACE41H_09780 [Paenibacillus enshidis]|uniref:Uncharacterized protein n=1 Tax=Paenibacillus enshidis TaxID=1458439 RepID=A0ABV5ASB6_9BACL
MSALTEEQLRICAWACITRFDKGEQNLGGIISSYALNQRDADAVLSEVYAKRPELRSAGEEPYAPIKGKWYHAVFRKKSV